MAMKVRALLSSVVLLSTMWLISCGHYTCGITFGSSTCTPAGGGLNQGGGGNTITQTAFVYFMDDNTGELALDGLNVGDSQTFAPVSSFVSPTGLPSVKDGGLVVVSTKYLYVPFVNSTLYGFSIDGSTGALTAVSPTPYSVSGPISIAADPNGALLFVGGTGGISTFAINADGTLTGPASTGTSTAPTQLATDGLGKYLYALTGNTISAFSYTSSGTLTALGTFSFSKEMTQIAAEKSGSAIFGIAGDANVYVFSIAQSVSPGSLSLSSTVPTTYTPVNLAVSPNGKFVYTFNQTATSTGTTDAPMEGFTFSSGTLTELPGVSPFTALTASVGHFDQSGQYLFAEETAPSSNVASTFAFGADTGTGALTSTLPNAGAPGTSFAVTDAP